MSLDRVYVSHKNSLNIKVNFERTREKATASALVDSGTTENFIDIRMVERWGLPRKVLPKPRPIVNVDGTENKAGMVTECYDFSSFRSLYAYYRLPPLHRARIPCFRQPRHLPFHRHTSPYHHLPTWLPFILYLGL